MATINNGVQYSVLLNVDTTPLDALLRKFDELNTKSQTTLNNLSRMAQQTASSMGQLNNQANQNARATQAAQSASDKFLNSLREQATRLSMTKEEYLKYQAALLGVGPAAQGYITQIAAASAATNKHGFSMGNARSKTELLVLAHEMAQGSFKRFGASLLVLAEATGAATLLFSPLGLAIGAVAAALGGLAYMHHLGAEELKSYNKAMLDSGNYAGLTSQQFFNLGKTIANQVGVSIADTDKVLTHFAGTGQFAGETLEQVTKYVMDYAKATGMNADETIKHFDNMKGSASKWAEETNKSSHFASEGQLQWIQSLEESGQKAQAWATAISLADQQVSDANKDAASQSMGYWDKFIQKMRNVGEAIRNAGRETPRLERIAELEAQQKQGVTRTTIGGLNISGAPTANAGLSDAEAAELKQLKDAQAASEKSQQEKTNRTKYNEDTSVLGDYLKDMKYRSKADQEKEALRKENERYKAAVDANNRAAGTKYANEPGAENQWMASASQSLEAAHNQRLANIKKQYEDKGPQTGLHVGMAAQKGDIEVAAEQEKQALAKIKELRSENSLSAKDAINIDADIQKSYLQQKMNSVDREIQIAQSGGKRMAVQMQDAVNKKRVYAEQMNTIEADRLAKQAALAQQEAQFGDAQSLNLNKQNLKLEEKLQHQFNKKTMSSRDAQLSDIVFGNQQLADDAVDTNSQKYKQKFGGGRSDDQLSQDGGYVQGLQSSNDAIRQVYQQRSEIEKQFYEKNNAYEADWKNGAVAAMQEYEDKALNVADNTKQAFSSAFNTMGQAFVQWATTGKVNIKQLAASFISSLVQMEAQAAEAAAIKGIMSLFGASGGGMSALMGIGGSTAGAGAGMVGANTYGFTMQANGGAWDKGTKFFADGAAFSNGVFSSPTSFGMQGGGKGVLGEAGPEAVMPLTRGSDGKLGVAVSNGGSGSATSGGSTIHNNSVTINVNGGNTNGDTGQVVSEATMQAMTAIAKQEIYRANRPGGLSNSLTLGTYK